MCGYVHVNNHAGGWSWSHEVSVRKMLYSVSHMQACIIFSSSPHSLHYPITSWTHVIVIIRTTDLPLSSIQQDMLNICQTWSSFSWNSLLKHDNDNMLQKCCSGQICLVHGIFKLPYQIWHQWLVWNLANWPKIEVGKNMMMRANNVRKYFIEMGQLDIL